jgi:protein-tyrosine-phosphatase
MAEAVAKHYLGSRQADQEEIRIISAGTWAVDNDLPTAEAAAAISELGIDLPEHRSRRLTPDLIGEADLILTMTNRQKSEVLYLAPEAGSKVFRLKEYACQEGQRECPDPNGLDIADPFGKPLEYYRACAAELRAFIPAALERFLNGLNK